MSDNSSTSTSNAKLTSGTSGGSGGLYGGDRDDEGGFEFNAPVNFGHMFGPDSDDEVNEMNTARGEELIYEWQTHAFPAGKSLKIRQFDDHITNANAVWPEARFLAGWLCGEKDDGTMDESRFRRMMIEPDSDTAPFGNHASAAAASTSSIAAESTVVHALPASATSNSGKTRKRVLELGAACGALSIFLSLMGVDMTASDIDDPIVTSNIQANATANHTTSLHLLPHTWGHDLNRLEADMLKNGPFDVIVASDILNYEKAFQDLVDTLTVLMPRPNGVAEPPTSRGFQSASPPVGSRSCILRMVWKRRSKGKDQERNFFDMLKSQHFDVKTERQKVFEIRRI